MTFPLPPAGPLFDAYAFARRLKPAVQTAGGARALEPLVEVSHVTISRACRGWAELSHENYLRLSAWLDAQREEIAA
jgi:hypothetical protein